MAKSLNRDKKKTQRILPAADPVDYSSLPPDEAMMLKEELALVAAGTDPRHLWFAAQEQSGPLTRMAATATRDGDRALRAQIRLARSGGCGRSVPKDTAFGMLSMAEQTLGFTRA